MPMGFARMAAGHDVEAKWPDAEGPVPPEKLTKKVTRHGFTKACKVLLAEIGQSARREKATNLLESPFGLLYGRQGVLRLARSNLAPKLCHSPLATRLLEAPSSCLPHPQDFCRSGFSIGTRGSTPHRRAFPNFTKNCSPAHV
ncbi:hypothetical protein BOTBODRAFT_445690 [Botryobasidium botryosum FD-172 SS1]|uniref:Uncharacterized protein n=1 Tax=Botryobasidium botryosum (strain FD-172 SS1) TaxID=930990 RepID=A0A067N7D5_BOTB1|nr:hypothetical protein BOTBODRAFT_445690 [Botryobasidium botryosum FD-172 SS1]